MFGRFTLPSRPRAGGPVIAAAVAATATLALAACGSSSDSGTTGASASSGTSANASATTGGGDKGKLLWVQPLRNNPVHRIMQGGFLSECKKLGYECEIVGSEELDMPQTAPLADAVLSKGGVKAMGVYAYDPSTYPFITKWGKDYPIVSWHIPVAQGTVQGLDAVTGCVPTAYAKEAALAIGKKINGTGTVAVTEGSFNTIENLVAKTFTDTMKANYPKVKVLKPQVEGFDAPAAKAKAVSILQSDSSINAAFSTTGGGPVTWAGAQQSSGRKLTIIGMDYVQQNLDLVKSGQVYAVVGQPLFQEGAKTADLLAELAEGKQVPYENPLPAEIITADKVAEYEGLLKQAAAAEAS
jgi:ribose transport system substrate-binding protein